MSADSLEFLEREMLAPSDPAPRARGPNAYWLPPDEGRNYLLRAEYRRTSLLKLLDKSEAEQRTYNVGDTVPTNVLESWTRADVANAYAAARSQAAGLGLAADTALPSVPGGVATDERNGAAELSVGAAKLLAAGHAADAEEMFKRALIYDPSNLAALQGLNGIAAKRGDHDTALEYAERLVANAPQRAQSHLLVGDAAFALEEFADAQRSWARAAALGSKSAAAKLVKFAAKLPTPPVEPPTPKPEPSAGAQAEPANSNDEPNVDPEGPDDAAPPAHVPGDDATTVSHG